MRGIELGVQFLLPSLFVYVLVLVKGEQRSKSPRRAIIDGDRKQAKQENRDYEHGGVLAKTVREGFCFQRYHKSSGGMGGKELGKGCSQQD